MVSLEDALKGIRLLKDAGMRKINFAGGEPFLYPKILGKMVDFCKEVSFLFRFSFSFFLFFPFLFLRVGKNEWMIY